MKTTKTSTTNFALAGLGGYITPKHLQAMKQNNINLICAFSDSDSVGIIDSFYLDCEIFLNVEDFFSFIKDFNQKNDNKIEFLTIITPNYTHKDFMLLALEHDLNIICEKPALIDPNDIEIIKAKNIKSKIISCVLQLRYTEALQKLKSEVDNATKDSNYTIDLTYITLRGKWFFKSWKGDYRKSGGLCSLIGIHFLDILIYIFGEVMDFTLDKADNKTIKGRFTFGKQNKNNRKIKADVNWLLSIDGALLEEKQSSKRLLNINGKEIDFIDKNIDPFYLTYKNTLNDFISGTRNHFDLQDASSAINLAYKIQKYINENFSTTIHKSAIIDENVKIGNGVKIWLNTHILSGASIGSNCNIGSNCVIGKNVKIGNGVKIQDGAVIYDGAIIEDCVFIGPNATFTNVLRPRAFINQRGNFSTTIVKYGATIGANSTIICGNKIGKYAMIGAGSVVCQDVEDYALYAGNKARFLYFVDKAGNKLEWQANTAIDSYDGSKYELKDNQIKEKSKDEK